MGQAPRPPQQVFCPSTPADPRGGGNPRRPPAFPSGKKIPPLYPKPQGVFSPPPPPRGRKFPTHIQSSAVPPLFSRRNFHSQVSAPENPCRPPKGWCPPPLPIWGLASFTGAPPRFVRITLKQPCRTMFYRFLTGPLGAPRPPSLSPPGGGARKTVPPEPHLHSLDQWWGALFAVATAPPPPSQGQMSSPRCPSGEFDVPPTVFGLGSPPPEFSYPFFPPALSPALQPCFQAPPPVFFFSPGGPGKTPPAPPPPPPPPGVWAPPKPPPFPCFFLTVLRRGPPEPSVVPHRAFRTWWG